MYFDDFIAQQVSQTNEATASHRGAPQPLRRLLRALWSGIRHIAWGIDAFSRVQHGIDVPPDHGARSRPRW